MEASPPEGTVTFLFTDLEGSTELWESHPQEMRTAVARHDELLHEIFEQHHGYVFTTAGDSFAVAFGHAGDAAAAAADVQTALAAATFDDVVEFLVRIGLHTGSAELREGDYFGHDVNVAARVMSAGHGGQIVLSDTTAALVPEVQTLDLGRHHLKGVRDARTIRQLVDDRLPREFPPLRTASTPTTNLPEARGVLIGRIAEGATITKALEEHRLVTLIGPGGVGKTSLAIDVADGFAPTDGTWLVDLAPVATEQHLAVAFADAIGLAESVGRPLPDQVVSHLRDLDAVLLVDNCEHVIDPVAELIDEILSTASSIRVLATSREVLDLPGEKVITVAPLALPGDGASHEEVRASAPLRLLELRAAASGGADALLDTNTDAALEVCRLVDGLPLAIELAAARLRSMSIVELASHLRDRFSILAAGRGRGARHRTLESVIEWSHDLLDEDEKRAFEHLSVFAGGFTAAAAATVAGPLGRIEMLARLVDKSLVATEPTESGTRYRMLETLRSFAAERLERRGDETSARDAHLSWSLELMTALENDMRTPRQDASLRSIRPEHDNLRAARSWAEHRDPVAALRITASAPVDAHRDRQARLAAEIENAEGASTDLLARARYTVLSAAFESGDFGRGVAYGQETMRGYEQLGDEGQLAYSRMMYAFCLWGAGELNDVESVMKESLAAFDALDDPMGRAYLNWCLAQFQLRSARDLGEVTGRARLAVELFSEVGSPFGTAHAIEGLGHALATAGHLDEAMPEMVDAFHQLHALGQTGCMAHALDGVAIVLVQRGSLTEGAEIVGAAERLREESGAASRPWEIDATERCLADLQAGLARDDLDASLVSGRELTLAEIVSTLDHLVD